MTYVLHMTAILRKLVKWFYILFAITAIALAVVVQTGRSLSPALADHPDDVSRYLSKRLNAQVKIGALKAEWDGLKPMVDLTDVRVSSQSGQPIIALQHAQLRMDLLSSLLHLRMVWSALQLDKAEMDFAQTSDGFWHIAGLPRKSDAGEPKAKLDLLMDMSLLSRRIEFNKTQLNFHFASGDKTVMQSPLLRMENTGDFHRLSLQIDVDNHINALNLIAEGHGDPRKKDSFSSQSFLRLTNFPTTEPIAAATALLLQGIKAEVHSEGSLDASLWFTSRPGYEGFNLTGKLGVQRLNLPIMQRKLALDSFSTDLVGHWLYSGKWQLALQNINANVNEHRIQKVNFAISADDFTAPLVLHMQHLDVEHLQKTLDSAGVLGDGYLRDTFRTLMPQGELQNLQVAIPTQNPADWELQANLKQVGVNAWQGVPALRKVDGFVHADKHGGFVDINSHNGFSMHYYPTYSAPMEYEEATGQVAWHLQPENNQIYVNSGELNFRNGKEQARGYMWLSLPWKRNTGDIDLYLQIGASQLDASLYQKYTPAVVPRSLLDWLEKSIGPNNAGFVNQVGFTYRGTLNNHNHAARSHQLYVDMSHAQLNYHPEWPALDSIDGRLLVNDDEVTASVDRARLFDSDVGPTEISTRPNPDGKGALLRVTGNVYGPATDGLRILRESMLRKSIGASMDSWKLNGNLQTRVDIAVPLVSDASGAAQQIDVTLNAPNFEIGNLKLAMQNVSGLIHYNHDTGLTSEDLQATLFDEPVRAVIGTKKLDGRSQTLVNLQGEVDAHALATWSQRPEALFMQGNVPYNAQVELNHGLGADTSVPFAEISVSSELEGVKVNLPAPYGKEPDSKRALLFNMAMRDKSSLIAVRYGDNLNTLFDLDPRSNNRLRNANVALGAPAQLSAKPGFLVTGTVPMLDIEPWKEAQRRYFDFMALLAGSSKSTAAVTAENAAPNLVAGLPFKADLLVQKYQVGPLPLEDVHVQAEPLIDAWKIQFTNPVVQGEVILPNENIQPVQINLESLHLTSALLGLQPAVAAKPEELIAQAGDAITKARGPSLDPHALPMADVSVKALFMDGNNYGNWSFNIRPTPDGALFNKIHGAVRGVTVDGIDEKSDGASLSWSLTDQGPSTHFVGTLSATDIAEVLRQWQKPDNLESNNARFQVDAAWAGDPQDFELKKIGGTMTILLENGRFKRSPGRGSDGFLRLMAILNFDSLARRLRLDFSDLYQSGLAYDRISGKVSFEPGTMTFTEPLAVLTPSSRMQLAGTLDLEREKINARLVATLPVVGNFTFFTALVTGLPAAAGIYLVSKLFKKQVDRATSLGYTITGSWDDPKMSFDRLFESEAKLLENAKSDKETKKTRKPKPKARSG